MSTKRFCDNCDNEIAVSYALICMTAMSANPDADNFTTREICHACRDEIVRAANSRARDPKHIMFGGTWAGATK